MDIKITIRHEKDDRKAKKLREFIEKKSSKIEKLIDKYKTPAEVKFILDVQKFRNKAEIILNSGVVKCTSTVESEDMLNSIESAIDSIVKQVKKQIEKKVTSKKRRSNEREVINTEIQAQSNHDIRLENAPGKPMSVDEAKLQLDIAKHNFVTFYNSTSGELNVLYKDNSDKLVLITP